MAQKDKPQKVAGENRRMLLNAMEGAKRPRVDVKDVQAIEQRATEYLEYCINNDVAPSVQGCANWLGISIYTLEKWYAGNSATPEHQRAAARIYGILQDIWAQKMDNGTINPVSGIFISKAMFGYRDQQEIVIHDGNSQSQLSVADLIAESKRLPSADSTALTDSSKTIDADYTVIDSDPAYQRAVARKKKKEERHEKAVERKKEYHKQYFQEHKEEFNERHRAYRKRDAEKNKQSS